MLFLWIILYGLVFRLSSLPLPPWVFPLCLLLFSAALLWWCCSGQRRKHLGLTLPVLFGKGLLWYLLVLLALPAWQLYTFRTVAADFLPLLTAVLAEELFFRGFLLQRLCRRSVLAGALGSAMLFAALHGMNYLAGYEPTYVELQILTAFSAGLFWGLLRLRLRSLLPCLLAHFFVNLTAAAPSAVDISLLFPGLFICCVLMIGSSIPLYQRIIHGGTYETVY